MHALVLAVAAVEHRVDGRGRRTGAGDVEGQVVVAVAAPHPAPQGPGAPGVQADGGHDRVVAGAAPGVEVEPAVQLARVAHRHLVFAGAAVHVQVRPGPGGDRPGDGEAQGVVVVAAPHVGVQGAGAPVAQGDGGRDRVVAGPAPGVEVEPAVQLARVAHRGLVGPAAAVHVQIRLGPGGDRAGDREAQRVVAAATLHLSLRGTRAPSAQGDGGRDRVVAGAAPGVEVEPAVQLARVAHRDLVVPGAAVHV